VSERTPDPGSSWQKLKSCCAGTLKMNDAKDWGSFITGFYLGLIAVYVISQWGKFCDLPPNELGDFLAGAFGPVAFLWLVLGYLQQGKELRQNGEALRMQADELRNSVEQHKELVRATQEQVQVNERALQHEINSEIASMKARFDVEDASHDPLYEDNTIIVTFSCRVSDAFTISAKSLSSEWKVQSDQINVEEGAKLYVHCSYETNDFPETLVLGLGFMDYQARPHSQEITLVKVDHGSYKIPRDN
jgi:hypothetical protein